MLAAARRRAPHLPWWEGDLATLDLHVQVDVALAAGNVLVFLEPGTEARAVQRLAAHLRPGGLLVTGFVVDARLPLDAFDADLSAAGPSLVQRWATWDRRPYAGGGHAVSVARRNG